MGNCQAIDAAALVIQHPNGKIERFYWAIPVGEVMRMNPGHYVSLIIPLPPPPPSTVSSDPNKDDSNNNKTVQFTCVKLLRPCDTLTLGHAYRLVTTQEVMKVLRAKKYAKMKKQQQPESLDKPQKTPPEKQTSESEAGNKPDHNKDHQNFQDNKHERQRPRTSVNSATLRSKSWRPSLQSISEATS